MWLPWNHQFTFRTYTGKLYPAYLFSLMFVDKKLEDSYSQYLFRKNQGLMELASLCAVFLAVLCVVIFNVTGYWADKGPLVYYIPLMTILWSLFFTFILRRYRRRESFYQWMNSLCVINHFFCIEWSITITSIYVQSQKFGSGEESSLEWLSALCIMSAVCFRRRVPWTIISTMISLVIDIVVAFAYYQEDVTRVCSRRVAVFSVTLATVIIFVYRSEMVLRGVFLNEKENESWQVDVQDIDYEKLIGMSGGVVQWLLGCWCLVINVS